MASGRKRPNGPSTLPLPLLLPFGFPTTVVSCCVMNVAHGDAIVAIQEAEFRVATSIAVREQYKTKLHTLVDALSSEPPVAARAGAAARSPISKAVTDASKKKQTRDTIADRLRVRATMPAGKELQVVGDWLLLLRAASVNVVESIAHWRTVLHQGRPLPYEVDHLNYLLQMAHDVDFLDRSSDLVAWLGFRLVRNPFIVAGGMDATSGNTRMDASPALHESRCKKHGTLPHPLPPQLLVKPLVSITPDDDVVDGSRIAEAHVVLRDEEALYGRTTTCQLVDAYLAKPLDASLLSLSNDVIDEDECGQNGRVTQTIFDDIAAQTKLVRHHEHRLGILQREHSRVVSLMKLVEDQTVCTTKHREQDLARDHRVWQYREKCRNSTLHSSQKSLELLTRRLESIHAAILASQDFVLKQKQRLDQLVTHKDHTRQQRQDSKRREQAEEIARRKEAIRSKTLDRNREITVRRAKQKGRNADVGESPVRPRDKREEPADEHLIDEIATTLGAPVSPVDMRVELDQKRFEQIERRREHRRQQEQNLSDEVREKNRRRDENAQMFLEDRLSWMLESRRRIMIRERVRKMRARKLTSTPICSIVQAIGGIGSSSSDKKFVVSVYQQCAKGYEPDGLRFVAYEPSTSTTLSLLVSTREYNSLGYGRTLEGLSSFCQWLCVIYEKRKRQFRLTWSGAPCPPPLRLREYDHALICVHKEGIRWSQRWDTHSSSSSFCFTSVYIRTNDPSKLRFVVSPVCADANITEVAIAAAQLLPTASLLLRSEVEGGRSLVSWLHTLDEDNEDNAEVAHHSTRVYSGEMAGFDDKQPVRVHIHDVTSTEYELHIDTLPLNGSQSLARANKGIVLLKHDVNPYRVRLPGSAFAELVSCIRLEQRIVAASGSDAPVVSAVLLPSWRACLARYVRAIRMAKFGCKIEGVFHLVVVTLVQQKTEFRAHLLFELAPIDEVGSRISLRISLSQFLRCPDANWRWNRSQPTDLAAPIRTCALCVENHTRVTTKVDATSFHATDEQIEPESEWSYEPCTACDVTQKSRLSILHTLLESGTLSSESDLATLFYATCSVCETVPPPIAIVVPSRNNRTASDEDGLEELLGHHFPCFEDSADTPDITDSILAALEHTRVCVIFIAAATIGTHSNAVSIVRRARQILGLDLHSELTATIAVVYRRLDIFHVNTGQEDVEPGEDIPYKEALHQALRDTAAALHQALRDTAAAILHVGEIAPVAFDDAEAEHNGVTNFEAYLVSEALLVEAMQVILHPDAEWRVPGETVGASSWSTACEFLRNPHQLSRDLQCRQDIILTSSPHARYVLETYAAHPKWPTSLEDVRAPFQALLSCVLHIIYVHRLLDLGGGLLPTKKHQRTDLDTLHTDEEATYETENGGKVLVIGAQHVQGELGHPASTHFIE